MSIDRINISNQGIDRAQSTQPSELTRSSGKDSQVSTGSDSVALSSKAKELGQLADAVDQSRAERLNKVREALESGTYHVSAKDIAEKLIDANKK
jgi:negative regulator of flagellin synthesis FlgM